MFVALGVLPVSALTNIPGTSTSMPPALSAGDSRSTSTGCESCSACCRGCRPTTSSATTSVRSAQAAQQRTAWSRLPIMAVKLPRVIYTVSAELQRVHRDTHAWWLRSVLEEDPNQGTDWVARIEDARRRFRSAISVHIRSRFLVQIAQSALSKARCGARVILAWRQKSSPGLGGQSRRWWLRYLEAVAGTRCHSLTSCASTVTTADESHMLTYSWRERPDRVLSMAASYTRREDVGLPQGDPTLQAMHAAAAEEIWLLSAVSSVVSPGG